MSDDEVTPRIIGLDIETSGLDPVKGHRIIQLGIHIPRIGTKAWDVGWSATDYAWDQAALDVNRFTHLRIQTGTPLAAVDEEASAWIGSHCREETRLVCCGWNVGVFDLALFVRPAMPKLTARLHRRTADLNAVCYAMEAAGIIPIGHGGTPPNASGIKRMAKRQAERNLALQGWQVEHHDAGFDAVMAIETWDILTTWMGRGRP